MMTTNRSLGIYVHIPFCIRKCPYCGFHSKAVGSPLDKSTANETEVYIKGIIAEIQRLSEMYSPERTVDSIFIGGGTPSILEPDQIGHIIEAVKDNFDVSGDVEITMEANPGTLGSKERIAGFKKGGINRLSLGVQSFDDEVLTFLGRIHTSKEAEQGILDAREAGIENLNLDLMFGIPGQSMAVWEGTLSKALELKPDHISFYSLQLEEGTPFLERFEAGEFKELSDALDREMYHFAIKKLKDAGYHHYEISNAALPGFECRHNIKYWKLEEYLGIGDGAWSYIEGKRFSDSEEQVNTQVNTIEDDMSEYTFTGLRMMLGINYGAFHSKFGRDFREVFRDRWDELEPFFQNKDLVELVAGDGTPMCLRLTEKGIDISNKIMAVFV